MKKVDIRAVVTIILFLTFAAFGTQVQLVAQSEQLEKKVLDTLKALPHYGVFDSISYKIEGQDVSLIGQVMIPITKQDAGSRLSKIPGIGKVVNNLEVLLLSPSDDILRISLYRSIFSTSDLYKYSMGADPSIHIIVKNGHVTLEGIVSVEQDSQLSLSAARNVPGSLSVKSNLKVGK